MFFQPTIFSCEKCFLLSDAKLVLSLTCLHTSTPCNETKLTKSSPRAEKTRQFVSTIDMSPHECESKTGWDSGYRCLSVEPGFLTP